MSDLAHSGAAPLHTQPATAWVVLGSSGQWSDWSQWPVEIHLDEQSAKDAVGRLSAAMRDHYAKRPEMNDADYDSGKWDRAMKRWNAGLRRIDDRADEYDQPHYTAREVPLRAEATTASSVGMRPEAECTQSPEPKS